MGGSTLQFGFESGEEVLEFGVFDGGHDVHRRNHFLTVCSRDVVGTVECVRLVSLMMGLFRRIVCKGVSEGSGG